MEQRLLLQRAGAGEAHARSAEAVNRDLEAHLSRANEDRQTTKSRSADVTKELDCLVTRVKTLERDLGTTRKAARHQQSYRHKQGRGLRVPRLPRVRGRGGGGGNAAGVRYLLIGAQAWHAQAESCAGQMSAVFTGLQMAMMATGQQGEGGHRGPQHPQAECRTRGCAPAVHHPPTASC